MAARPAVFRFAPSPNGYLHAGHAYSAILNYNRARQCGGAFLLRIEDIDPDRSRPHFCDQIFDDLAWLGLSWETPVRYQSRHMADYRAALRRLGERVPLYRGTLSRQAVRRLVEAQETERGVPWPRDPDGVPHYPASARPAGALLAGAVWDGSAVRMMTEAAVAGAPELHWTETGAGPGGETGRVRADPLAWGDVMVARRDVPASYPLCVVLDDALQGVTHVVRGQDLFWATSVQRLLQHVLDLPAPVYHHHPLVLDVNGRKLAKSRGSLSLKALREAGTRREELFAWIGIRPV